MYEWGEGRTEGVICDVIIHETVLWAAGADMSEQSPQGKFLKKRKQEQRKTAYPGVLEC